MKVSPNGNIVVLGYEGEIPATYGRILQLEPDGTPDSGFAGTGLAPVPLYAWFKAGLGILSNGSIRAFSNAGQFFIGLFSSGASDLSFGQSGSLNSLDILMAGAMEITRNDKIVLAGIGDNFQFEAVRLNANGSLDPSFGSNGKTILGNAANSETLMAQDSDGRLFVAGAVMKPSGGPNVFSKLGIYSLSPDGAVDYSFGDQGLLTVNGSDLNVDYISDFKLQSDGTIIISGTGQAYAGQTNASAKAFVTRYTKAETHGQANAKKPITGALSAKVRKCSPLTLNLPAHGELHLYDGTFNTDFQLYKEPDCNELSTIVGPGPLVIAANQASVPFYIKGKSAGTTTVVLYTYEGGELLRFDFTAK